MWIASTKGFYSIKQDTPTGRWFIRARVRKDLENLQQVSGFEGTKIEDWPTADYRYRIIVGAEGLAAFFEAMEASITYDNFKGQIARTPDQRDKLSAYHAIWHEMAQLQYREADR